MLIGYARVSKSDGSQVLDLQHDALAEAGVEASRIYEDLASGRKDDRPGLTTCLKALQPGNTLVVWKLDRLGRDLKHLVGLVDMLNQRQVGLQVLAGTGAQIDTTTANGRLVFGIFAALAEFEGAVIRERTKAGLTAARARGRVGGRPRKMTATTLKMAMTAMADPGTSPKEVARRLGITTTTLYTYVNGDGSLKESGQRTLNAAGAAGHRAVRQGIALKSKP
jgi:DNA invertase Pin-like site-specific DNA recombinase